MWVLLRCIIINETTCESVKCCVKHNHKFIKALTYWIHKSYNSSNSLYVSYLSYLILSLYNQAEVYYNFLWDIPGEIISCIIFLAIGYNLV